MVQSLNNFFHLGHLGLKCLKNYPLYLSYKLLNPGESLPSGIARNFFYSKAIIDFAKEASRKNLLTTCDLEANSIVFDVGGYKGEWAKAIHTKYCPYIHIFEPIPDACQTLQKTFQNADKVFIHPYGLADKNMRTVFSASGMGSSIYSSVFGVFRKTKKISVELRDFEEVFRALEVNQVDLIKINIEGGEYSLLPRMLETGIIDKFKIIRVQFHEWIPGAPKMRRWITNKLSETHELEWDYPFVWESWRHKAN